MMKKMKYESIYQKYKLILDMKYASNIFTDEKVARDFYRQASVLNKAGENSELARFVREYFNQHQNNIDVEAYIFYTLKTIIESGKESEYPVVVDECKKALKRSNFRHYEIDKQADIGSGNEIKCITAQDLTGENIQEDETEKRRVEAIEKNIPLMFLFSPNSNQEMKRIFCKNKDLANYITRLGLLDLLRKVMVIPQEDMRRMLTSDVEGANQMQQLVIDHQEELKELDPKILYERIPEYLKKFPAEFDMDAILLIAACRMNAYLEESKVSKRENEVFSETLLLMRENIQSKRRKVTGIVPDVESDRGREFTYTYKDLLEACSRISKSGRYLSRTEENDIRKQFEAERVDLENIDPEFVKLIHFSQEEYDSISSKNGAFDYLVENDILPQGVINRILRQGNVQEEDLISLVKKGFIDSNQINIYLSGQASISEDLFKEIEERKLLNTQEKFNYYMSGKLDFSMLSGMNDDAKTELADMLSIESLMDLYKDPDKKDDYFRYATLVRSMMLHNKTKDEKEAVEQEIIECLGDMLDNDHLVELYKEHLISLKAVKEWGGDPLITQMMRNAILKPIDVKEICSDGDYGCVIDIMKDGSIPRKNKLAIFYTTFSEDDKNLTEEQKEKRKKAEKECLKLMNLYSRNVRNSNGTGRTVKGIREQGTSRNEYVSDPLSRWNLINLLDPEYSYEMLDQGMMIFKLPNLKDGTIILEKMFKKDEPDYARATKVLNMPIEEFEKIKHQLIIDGDIPVMAVEQHPKLKNRVISVIHDKTWGKKLADLFDYSIDPRRTPDEVAKINKEIERILNSRRLR